MGHMRRELTPIQQKLFEIIRARTWNGEPDEELTLAAMKKKMGDCSNGTVTAALGNLSKRGLVTWKGGDYAGTLRATGKSPEGGGAAAPATASRRSKASTNGHAKNGTNGHGAGGGRRGIRIDQETLARLRAVEDELEKKLESLRTTIALLEG